MKTLENTLILVLFHSDYDNRVPQQKFRTKISKYCPYHHHFNGLSFLTMDCVSNMILVHWRRTQKCRLTDQSDTNLAQLIEDRIRWYMTFFKARPPCVLHTNRKHLMNRFQKFTKTDMKLRFSQ